MTEAANTNQVPSVNDVLEGAKNKYENVLVLGFSRNHRMLEIATSRPTFEFVNYALDRASFQVNLMENDQNNQALMTEAQAEQAVRDQVQIPMEPAVPAQFKKRGRKPKVA